MMNIRCTPRTSRSLVPLRATAPQTKYIYPDDKQRSLIEWFVRLPVVYDVIKAAGITGFKYVAKKYGVQWDDRVSNYQLVQNELEAIYKELEDPNIEYPAYYEEPIHAYETGNLGWTAAYEVENALEFLAMRRFPEFRGQPEQAKKHLLKCVGAAILTRQPTATKVLDLGCGVGISSRMLANVYSDAQVTAIDLSPHFLSVAEYRARQMEGMESRFRHIHMKAEEAAKHLPNNEFDVVQLMFVIHECPREIIAQLLENAFKLLKSGGCFVLTDTNPLSSDVREAQIWRKMTQQMTEPFLYEYYNTDLMQILQDVGFESIQQESVTIRDATWTATKPALSE